MAKSGKDLQDLWDIVDMLLAETPLRGNAVITH